MSAFTQAVAMYPPPHRRQPEHREFEKELTWHLANGYVHSEPGLFAIRSSLVTAASPGTASPYLGRSRITNRVLYCFSRMGKSTFV